MVFLFSVVLHQMHWRERRNGELLAEAEMLVLLLILCENSLRLGILSSRKCFEVLKKQRKTNQQNFKLPSTSTMAALAKVSKEHQMFNS
jgi:hypothetical protein